MPSTTVLNLAADTGKNIIGSESTPLLEITNSGTGPGLKLDRLLVTSTATLTAGALTVATPILAANATVGALAIRGASVASGAVLALTGAQSYVSAVSLIFAAGAGWAGMGAIRIVRPDGTFGWIPVLPNAQVTAAAVE